MLNVLLEVKKTQTVEQFVFMLMININNQMANLFPVPGLALKVGFYNRRLYKRVIKHLIFIHKVLHVIIYTFLIFVLIYILVPLNSST